MNKWLKLASSLAIDFFGVANAFGAAEVTDLAWAPLSAIAIWLLYKKENYSLLGFAEEILPFTDFLPTATLAWYSSTRKA